ncbi:uncharacterized protein [Pyxicephalus adspersus]|uniref:uncharacterized protein n=1 Tax=Pyxicephalus adspersus TaxID=30357 RepID=UPI003B5A3C88
MNSEAVTKINQIKQLLDQIYVKKKGKLSSGHVIGIFTSLDQSDVAWIEAELKRVCEHVKEIRYVNTFNIKIKDMEKAISECTFCIYTSSEKKWKSFSPSERKKTFSFFGKKVLIVLIINMEDSSDEEKSRIIKDQPRIKEYVLDVFLIKRIETNPINPQDIAFDRGSMNSFRGGAPELSTVNPDQQRHSSYRLPKPTLVPDAIGESSEKQYPEVNLDKYRKRSYRLPQPAPALNGHQTDMSQRMIDRKHIVGIFSRSVEQDYDWLVRLLKEAFQDFVADVKYFYISNNGCQQLREDMSQCTFGILYHTKNRGRINITDVTESLYDEELEVVSAELGRRNMIVVIDDVEDSSDEEKTQILQNQPSISKRACELYLISVSDKANKARLITNLKSLKFIFTGEYSNLKTLNNERSEQNFHPPNPRSEPQYTENGAGNASPMLSRERRPNVVPTASKSTVAIFSRSEESDYSWLSQQLSSEDFDVRSYKISSPRSDQPHETAFQCKLAILYHNMNNGKLRLTDTKDALYHEELEMLSTKFGKRRLIVVVDDLVKSDDHIKSEILVRQPSTGRFARDLFLFSMEEKKYFYRKDPRKEGRRMMDKINTLKEMLSK